MAVFYLFAACAEKNGGADNNINRTIPEENLCIQIAEYQIETLQLNENMVKNLRIVKSDKLAKIAVEDEDNDLA